MNSLLIIPNNIFEEHLLFDINRICIEFLYIRVLFFEFTYKQILVHLPVAFELVSFLFQ